MREVLAVAHHTINGNVVEQGGGFNMVLVLEE